MVLEIDLSLCLWLLGSTNSLSTHVLEPLTYLEARLVRLVMQQAVWPY